MSSKVLIWAFKKIFVCKMAILFEWIKMAKIKYLKNKCNKKTNNKLKFFLSNQKFTYIFLLRCCLHILHMFLGLNVEFFYLQNYKINEIKT